jgi:magnesium-transporting ATPase (P-type)
MKRFVDMIVWLLIWLLAEQEYSDFASQYAAASASMSGRDALLRACMQSLESGLDLVALSGVEDALQEGVKAALETLRQANIKVWMLTGDKAETAMCIGRAARLCDYGQEIVQIHATNRRDALRQLDVVAAQLGYSLGVGMPSSSSSSSSLSSSSSRSINSVDSASSSTSSSASSSSSSSVSLGMGVGRPALLIDGVTLQLCLEYAERQFMELAVDAPAVICW